METIVVGSDGSKSSQVATRWAADQAKLSGAYVRVVLVVPRTALWSMSALQVNIDNVLDELRRNLAGPWSVPLRRAGVEHMTRVVRGDPAMELLKIATRVHASMLVLGSKSHSTVADLVVGGTAHKIINRSPVPVVLVPAPRSQERAARRRAS